MITQLEPDVLECEVKWALESITTNKTSAGDRIPVELFPILKDDAVKVLQLNMPANLENSAVATGLEKVGFHSNPKERQCQRMLKPLQREALAPQLESSPRSLQLEKARAATKPQHRQK